MSEEVKFTPEQLAAIDFSRSSPAVVTAAAGSGKTTLLVERIIRLISDVNNPINAASLAIMTFTVNATQSLREKLNRALQERISAISDKITPEAEAEKNYLSEQIINLRNASISTINSFCLGIIRENFQLFDLPISFSIADDTKKTSMQWSAEQLVKQDFYDENGEGGFSSEERDALFYTFNFEDDKLLFENVVAAANMLSSYGNIDKWLDEAADAHSSIEALEKNYMCVYVEFIDKQFAKLRNNLDKITESVRDYKNYVDNEENDKKRDKNQDVLAALICSEKFDKNRFSALETDYEIFKDNPTIDTLEALIEAIAKTPENTSERSRGDAQNAIKKRFNKSRDAFQKAYSKLMDISVSRSEEELILPERKLCAKAFAKLVKKYISYYSEIKRAQGYIDFSDCELLLLDKLQSDEDFRNQLSKRFSCIIVDEFQDSNDVQAEIFRLLGNGKLFYVGDVKQSIYAFRGGNPMIMAQLCKGTDGFTPLPLNKNFRSRRQVIDVVNAAFCGLMTEEYGGVDYENGNKLEFGADFKPLSDCEEKNFSSEIFALDVKEASDEKEMINARFTAGVVRKIMQDENFFITKKGEKVRPTYSDFIILMRNNSKIKYYRDAFSELDIPSISSKTKNFLFSEEISLIISLLRVIDNPLRDEDTLKVLMSPLYRFSAEEVAELKLGILGYNTDDLSDDDVKSLSCSTKKSTLYRCLKFCTKSDGQKTASSEQTEKELSARGIIRNSNPKAVAFLHDLELFRSFMSNNSTDNLISKIYEETDIFAVVSAYDDSRRRISNLRRFETIAADFVVGEYGMLSDFLRFLDKSMQNSVDIEEAATPEDSANSVRIMTFHASKGLEAPICILAELDDKVNISDSKGSFLINHDYYFSMDYVDRKNRFREKTFSGNALKLVNRKKPVGEELRLLYVAMTRAREKLIMIAPITEKKLAEIPENSFEPDEIFEQSIPFRWILSSLMRKCSVSETKADKKTVREYSFDDLPLELNVINDENYADYVGNPSDKLCDDNGVFDDDFDEEAKALSELISKPYHNIDETRRQAKFSVTELAHKTSQIPFTLTKPAFALSGKMSGADLGNAYHHCMEHISFDIARNSPAGELVDNIAAELCRLCDEGKITEDEMNCIKPEKIAGFFTSNLGKRLLKSDKIEREFPFYAELEGSEIDDNLSGVIGVQGRIDACFEENGKLVVIDYKTDYDINAEKDAYEKQVKIYAGVLPMLLGKSVSQTYLYSFSEGKEILL